MRFQILSLSGGGYLGLYTASVLAELEASAGRPLRESFDLIAGTSVGGIIALGLAAGTPAAEIRDAFLKYGPKIFSNRPPPQNALSQKLSLLKNVFSAKYRTAPLKKAINEIVGAETLIGDLEPV